MLSNSNVFILLILIKYLALFETTLANSVAVNAHDQFDDTEFSTIKTVTTSLSHVDHNSIEDGSSTAATAATAAAMASSATSQITDDIKSATSTTTTTTKDPLVVGNRKQFRSIVEDSVPIQRSTTIVVPLQSTIDHVIKLTEEEIPSKQQPNANLKKGAPNVSSTLEMVSSTLANANASSHLEKNIHNSTTLTSQSVESNHQGNLEINSNNTHSTSYTENSSLMDTSNNNSDRNNPIIDDNGSIKKSVDYVNSRNDDDNNDYVNSDIQLPQADAPSISGADTIITADPHQAELMKPRPDAVYFVVAVIGGAKIWARTLARTLQEMGPPFSGDPLGSPLRPIYVDLPTNGRFSVNVLLSLCQQSEKRPLAGVVVIGNGQSAHAVASAGSAMQLPVLWAKGGTTNLHELHPEASLQALLQPSAIEIFEAVRSLFLQTHWHSFFVLSDVQATNVMNVKDNPLRRAPLVPTIVPLPRNNDDVFKQLAQISRSTRGVILLLGNLQATRRIMTEAHRLNMVGGHFIWLWIDTSSSTGYFHQATAPIRRPTQPQQPSPQKSHNESDAMSKNATDSSSDKVHKVASIFAKPTNVPKSSSGKSQKVGNGRDEQPTKVDFSQGFDPFRVMQRQDEQPKQTFNSPQHYQERTIQRDNKQTPANRLILGLRGENGHTNENDDQNTQQRSKKTRRSNAKANNVSEHSHGDRNRNGNKSKNGNGNGDENGNINYSANDGDEMPIFLSNQTNAPKNSNASKYRNFSDDNLDEFIDNNNFNEIHNTKLNPKRTSTANGSTSSSFVNFHQFKDFPVGLLALRPIRMNVDRHFIRAAVRLFAVTWEKINSSKTVVNPTMQRTVSSTATTTLPQSRRTQPNRNAQATTTLYNSKKFGNEMHSRKMRRKRNIHAINQLLTVTMEKRSIKESTATERDTEQQPMAGSKQVNSTRFLNEFSGNSDSDNVNVKHLNRGIGANWLTNRPNANKNDDNIDIDDIHRFMQFNSSFTSDLPNNKHTNNTYYANNSVSLKNVNVSYNRNFSGLRYEHGKNKSNIDSLNNERHQTITNMVISNDGQVFVPFTSSNVTNQLAIPFNRNDLSTESMAKQASQSVVWNFFGNRSQDIRQPSNKRQNTWMPTKKGASTATSAAASSQSKRPQYDANQLANAHQAIDHEHNNHIKCETPSYFGGCYGTATAQDVKNAEYFSRALREATKLAMSGRPIYNGISETALTTNFELLNLVPSDHPYHSKINDNQAFQSKIPAQSQQHKEKRSIPNANATNILSTTKWRRVGLVSASSVRLDTIVWPGGDIVVSGLSAGARSVFRIVTALAPPFVMESELDEDGLCLRGLPCHRVSPVGRHNLTLMFNAIETRDRLEEDAVEHGNDLPPEPEHLDEKISHVTKCCYGLTMDLLDNIATELSFEFHLYVVRDQLFGSKQQRDVKDFLRSSGTKSTQHHSNSNGSGDTNTAATTTTATGTSTSQQSTDHDDNDEASNNDHWNGIIGDLVSGSADMSFAPLSVSQARAQAIDFSIPYFHSGVSLLASPKTKSEIPLLAFLLPFSPELWIAIFTSLNITAVAVAVYEWLSPFGLNPWGRQRSKNFSLSSALWVMWGLLCGHLVAFKAPKSWPNKFLINVWGGFSVIFVASYTANIAALIAGLFFHHAASSYDSSLTTQRVGAPIASAAESYVQNKDKHLWEHMKKYSLNHIEDGIRGLKNGTLDLLMADSPILDYYRATDHGCSLQRIGETFVEDTYAIGMVKGFPLKESISALIAKYSSNGYLDILTEKWYGGLPCFKYESEIVTPRPLGVAAVAGVFLLLGLGMVMGVVILIFEHWFYKYALPSLRLKPKGTIWKSRNIMFFSQKLYRFINCVELVSPHHAARELVHSIRQGQIASLFQKSIKRKEDEQRRRRKSKAQFFEMIQEIRRAQQVERQNLAAVAEAEPQKDSVKSPPSLFRPRASPKPSIFSALKKDGRSRSNSSVLTPRRFSTDSILGDRMDSIGRRLSRDLTNSPPDVNRRYGFGKNELSPQKYDTISGSNLAALGISKSNEALSNRYDTFSGKNVDKGINLPVKLKKPGKRPKISFESYHRDRSDSDEKVECEYELPPVKEGLEPSMLQKDRNTAILRHKLHQELRAKHPPVQGKPTVTIVENVSNSVDRPPLPKKIIKHQRQKSLDNLDVKNDASNTSKTSPYQSDSSAGSLTKTNQRSQISLERLSREDLLRLSHSSQSEIHEYLKGSPMPDRAAEPP